MQLSLLTNANIVGIKKFNVKHLHQQVNNVDELFYDQINVIFKFQNIKVVKPLQTSKS